jgi:hypothetical protein
MKRVVLATGAALLLAFAGLTTSITAADAQKGPNAGGGGGAPAARGGGGGGGGGAPAARGGGGGGPNIGGGFRSGGGGSFRSGGVSPQFGGGAVNGGRFAGRGPNSGAAVGGRVYNHNGGRHFARRHFRGGPGFYAYGGGYYDDYYPGYSSYDDDCYETQRVFSRGAWRLVRVYVCE